LGRAKRPFAVLPSGHSWIVDPTSEALTVYRWAVGVLFGDEP
jgi:hypothetical protein